MKGLYRSWHQWILNPIISSRPEFWMLKKVLLRRQSIRGTLIFEILYHKHCGGLCGKNVLCNWIGPCLPKIRDFTACHQIVVLPTMVSAVEFQTGQVLTCPNACPPWLLMWGRKEVWSHLMITCFDVNSAWSLIQVLSAISR